MSMFPEGFPLEKDYSDGRTKQAFKDSTDINLILARAANGQTITHLAKHGAVYGDFSDIDDLLNAHERLKKGQEIFDQLPGEVRKEFNQDIGEFYRFVNDPANVDRLGELLPGLAAPGAQLPELRKKTTEVQATMPDPDLPDPPPPPPPEPGA